MVESNGIGRDSGQVFQRDRRNPPMLQTVGETCDSDDEFYDALENT